MTGTEHDQPLAQSPAHLKSEVKQPLDDGEHVAASPTKKPGPIKRAAHACFRACSNVQVKNLFCRFAPILSVLTFGTLVLLICAILLFVFLYPSGGLFVTKVETTRLEYDVTNENRSEIRLQGVLISAKGGDVVDVSQHEAKTNDIVEKIKNIVSAFFRVFWQEWSSSTLSAQAITVETRPDYFCYSGIVKPLLDSRIEMDIDDGKQVLRISNVRPSIAVRPPWLIWLMQKIGKDEEDTQPANAKGTLATLSFNGQDLAVRDSHQDPPEKTKPTDPNTEEPEGLMLKPLNFDDVSDPVDMIGEFAIKGPITISQDPGCAQERGENAAFASPLTPVTIDGPAVIGRKLRTVGGATVADDDLPVIKGETEILIRQVLCWKLFSPARFFASDRSVSGDQDRSCTRIYPTNTEPVSFPAGSAFYGTETNWFPEPLAEWFDRRNDPTYYWSASPSHFYGQVEFKDGRYHANLSAEANRFHILRPGAGGTTDNSNVVSVPFLTRVLLEPSLVVLTSLFLAFCGLILGILQIERDEERSQTNTGKPADSASDDCSEDKNT